MKKWLLPIALGLGFLLIAVNLYLSSKPSHKAQIYTKIKKYSPYYFQKSLGGLNILKKGDKKFKISPDNSEVFHKLEELEMKWGATHLAIENDTLHIYADDKTVIKNIPISSIEDRKFLQNYYGLK